jgi:hypothetical protein
LARARRGTGHITVIEVGKAGPLVADDADLDVALLTGQPPRPADRYRTQLEALGGAPLTCHRSHNREPPSGFVERAFSRLRSSP